MELQKQKSKRKKYRTRRRRVRLAALKFASLLTLLLFIPGFAILYIENKTSREIVDNYTISIVAPKKQTIVKAYEVMEEAKRQVTAYNAGDPAQTDGSPCISASQDNICELLALGQKICAANFVPLGTLLHIEGFGECLVLDRMAKRYSDRVDIAMQAHEKQEALAFNKILTVRVLR